MYSVAVLVGCAVFSFEFYFDKEKVTSYVLDCL